MDKNKRIEQAFIALLRAGLWGQNVELLPYMPIDFDALRNLAEEQSVVGLIAAGIEHVTDMRPSKNDVLQFIGQAMQLEQRNTSMNSFIGVLADKLRDAGITAILVKGQGIAQCYEKPLWRSCGDVDLLLSESNYEKAKAFLKPLAASVDEEDTEAQHLAMTIDQWVVELHGTLHSGLWKALDKAVEEIQDSVCKTGRVRIWNNSTTDVMLPAIDEDVVFVFSHILQHYFKEGIGLRQICDWCRLMWTYREYLDVNLLASRLRKMGVMTEWMAFGALAVEYLGMPKEAMPLYSPTERWKRKASKILDFIFETGNFGHNRDYSYQKKYPFVVFKAISLWRHIQDFFKYVLIFPIDSVKVMWNRVLLGVRVAMILRS